MDKILEPVYFVRDEDGSSKLYVPFEIDDGYGLVSLAVTIPEAMSSNCDELQWFLRFKIFNGDFVVEVQPKLSLFKGRIETPNVWRPRVVKCNSDRVYLIKTWIETLNGK